MLCIDSPIGPLAILSDEKGILSVKCRRMKSSTETVLEKTCAKQLDEFFAGNRTEFSLPLVPSGTAFQELVWKELQQIPFGMNRTYGEVAARISLPNAARAVGNAVGENPILILIPCHRVVPSDGSLGGFSAGVSKKSFLLQLEQSRHVHKESLVA